MHRLAVAWRIIRGVQQRVQRANLSLVAAGGAFFAMLSLFPGLAAVIALLGFVADPGVVDEQLDMLAEFVPADAFALIEAQIRRLVATNTSTLGWATAISTGAALWSARLGTDAIIQALNAVHGAPMRGGMRAAAVALLTTLALMVVAIVAVLTMVVLPIVMAILPTGAFTAFALQAARWIVALAVVVSGIWVLYRFAPNGPGARVAWLSPGAALAVVVWAAGSWGFSWYLANFASYNEVYGSIGAVIALMMFLYITISVVLLGAALNAELHEARRLAAGAAPDTSAAPQAEPDTEPRHAAPGGVTATGVAAALGGGGA